MATFAEAILPAIDQLRGLSGLLGLRNTKVTARVVSWPGGRPGLLAGTSTYVDTRLTVASNNPQNPKVVQVSAKDAMASGGLLTNQDLKVGPLSPAFAATTAFLAGGTDLATIDPPQPTAGTVYQQIYFKVEGTGFQSPVWFERIEDESLQSLRRFLYLRRSGVQEPGGAP